MPTTKGKAKAKKKTDTADTATVAGKGNPGVAAVAKPRGLAARMGKKAKAPPSAPSAAKAPEVTVDKKLPGHDARQAELKNEVAEIQDRVKVYGKMAKSRDKAVVAEAERLTEAAADELKRITSELAKSGLVVDEWREARTAKADAEKRMSTAFKLIGPLLEKQRIDMSRSKMEELSSLDVVGGIKYIAGSMITGLTGDAMKTEEQLDNREAELRKIFGDRYDEFMLRKKQQSLNMDLLNADPDFADGLYDAIITFCEEQGRDPMVVIQEKDTLTGRRALVTARVMDPKGQELFDKAKSEGLLGLKSAHLRK